jgi:hypothetical protein
VADSEYNRLARAVRRSRTPAPPHRNAPAAAVPTPAEIAQIKFAQSLAAKAAFTRAVLERIDATPADVEIDERKLLASGKLPE